MGRLNGSDPASLVPFLLGFGVVGLVLVLVALVQWAYRRRAS